MRIIAGEARGRQLVSPKGLKTRPTLDRVKESLFGIIQFDLYGTRFLDLFSGSGGIGLEALSRGAAFCTFVDSDQETAACVRKNIDLCGFKNRSSLRVEDFSSALVALHHMRLDFDIIFLDPPYKSGFYEMVTSLLISYKLLREGGTVIAEHLYARPPKVDPSLTLFDTRKYGDVGISFYREGL
ncbi:MAG: 16S rRNA (guanine(966)-N(2))-methyltransferase RsmD [Clostridia bacterium]